MMLSFLIAVSCLARFAYAAEVCYDRLGCFPDGNPWTGTKERPIYRTPQSPEQINTRFYLYNKDNISNRRQELKATEPSTIAKSKFHPEKKTVMLIHGFLDNSKSEWVTDTCQLLVQVDDVNCIVVDWKKGGMITFTQSAHNVRVVGAEISYFLSVLEQDFKYFSSKVHLVGHSLGSHIAGEAGKRIPGIARITGLDPAEPYFQNTPAEVRLDPTDALFVDVIHTDASCLIPSVGLGMMQAAGHLDFYPNGGEYMPGCSKNMLSTVLDLDGIWEGTTNFVACNHNRAIKYFTESITIPEGYLGFPCADYNTFQSGTCFNCSRQGCPAMGYFADSYKVLPGIVNEKFYLNTGGAKPYARWRYIVVLKLTGNRAVSGDIRVALYGTKGNSRQHQLVKALLKPRDVYSQVIDVEADPGEILKVKFIWENSFINPILPKLGAESITITRGRDGKEFHFCGSGTVKKLTLQTLVPCASTNMPSDHSS
ncbi:inactive pancreatic lipase-related protein 1-like [Acipenser oxyrinchus oxyrinchus]|uniref:Triacylglycerol lipase n=1 Tax=Acipenser oxyrinchus oxyrinchus TaxID=40147 RepID=A0AAD8G584_ACIOX|nr:inactive pancreatic lipase-related protein 1-like [Acipenser oxyrinchus oxyrinchus]